MAIKPSGDNIALQILDDAEAPGDRIGANEYDDDQYDKLISAQIVGVGEGPTVKEKKLKRGQVVLVRAYVADGTKLDDDTILADAWSVVAFVIDE